MRCDHRVEGQVARRLAKSGLKNFLSSSKRSFQHLNNYHVWHTKKVLIAHLGEILSLSAIAVGKITNKLKLKEKPYAERRLSMAAHTSKEIEMYYYNQEALQKIKDYLGLEPLL